MRIRGVFKGENLIDIVCLLNLFFSPTPHPKPLFPYQEVIWSRDCWPCLVRQCFLKFQYQNDFFLHLTTHNLTQTKARLARHKLPHLLITHKQRHGWSHIDNSILITNKQLLLSQQSLLFNTQTVAP